MSTNTDYWEQVLQAPTPAYRALIDAERKYLIENIPVGARVLDIGCGEGRNIRTILERTKNVVGADVDKKAVAATQKNFADIPEVKIIKTDAAKLPFDDGYFDIVTFLMILPNLDKLEDIVMGEAARVLKPGGMVILSTYSENAFDERMKMYKKTKAPIMKIDGATVVFDKSIGANVSKQFSKEEIRIIAERAGLKLGEVQAVGVLAYICALTK